MLASSIASPVGLLASHGVALAVAGHGERVDGVDRAVGRAQAGHQQPACGLDGDRDRIVKRVAVLGQQRQQGGEAGGVVADA
jgi:hypothetical protein